MKKKKNILFKLLIFVIILVVAFFIKQKIDFNNAWRLEVVNNFINVRAGHSVYESQIDTVSAGEEYEILDIYLDDNAYIWYQIKTKSRKIGWISSSRNNPFVKEINNPNNQSENSYFIDYKLPIIKYFENVYIAKNLQSIDYKHLTIEDDSNYEINHVVYFEEFPVDKKDSQYWIEYIVVDSFQNESRILQSVEFETPPSRELVSDFQLYLDRNKKR